MLPEDETNPPEQARSVEGAESRSDSGAPTVEKSSRVEPGSKAPAPAPHAANEEPPAPAQPAPAAAAAVPPTSEFELRISQFADAARTEGARELLKSASEALVTFDLMAPLIHQDDADIATLLSETREELIDSFVEAAAGRPKIAFMLARGVMEGLFTALFYRQQSMSLHLWAANEGFLMVHQLLEPNHEFYKYFKLLFLDERFKQQYTGVTEKRIFAEAKDLYDLLSNSVHKKSTAARAGPGSPFADAIQRVFRIGLAFLEREEELPKLDFPKPPTFCSLVTQPGKKK